MSASAIAINTGLFDRAARRVPPLVIAASAAFAAYEAAPFLLAYLHSEPAPIVADAPLASPEPITAPAPEIEATPRLHATPRRGVRVAHHGVKHVHHRQHIRHHERALEPTAETQVDLQAPDVSPASTFVRPGRPIPLTSSDFFLRLFGLGRGG